MALLLLLAVAVLRLLYVKEPELPLRLPLLSPSCELPAALWSFATEARRQRPLFAP
jgi:hypothetical protein